MLLASMRCQTRVLPPPCATPPRLHPAIFFGADIRSTPFARRACLGRLTANNHVESADFEVRIPFAHLPPPREQKPRWRKPHLCFAPLPVRLTTRPGLAPRIQSCSD